MERERLLQHLMATFQEELTTEVSALNRDLLALEQAAEPGRAELINRLFRSAHSLKGAARAVGLRPIETACHGLETLLAKVRDGGRALGPELFELLFTAVDALSEAGQRLRGQKGLEGTPLAALLPRLEAAVRDTAPAASPAAAANPEPEPRPESRPQPEPRPAPKPEAEAAPLPAAVSEPVIRVKAEKLDALLARTGELLVSSGRLESRIQDIQALREFIDRWEADFRALAKPLRRLLAEGSARSSGPVGPGAGVGRAYSTSRRAKQVLAASGKNFRKLSRDLERLGTMLARDNRMLQLTTAPLVEQVRHLRTLPFAESCDGLSRVARDLSHQLGKEVRLVVEGAEVELDRAVLEGLKAPLMHLVRNAIDHGIEPPETRRKAGKPPLGQITVSASLHGAQVHIAVADDGQGLDITAIRERARLRGLPLPAAEQELARAIFTPGFSTTHRITDISGRGVGLDVVKSAVEALHGSVDLQWQAGRGTRFTLTVPLTLTVLRGLLVSAAAQRFVFPTTSVKQLLLLGPEELHSIEGWPSLVLGGLTLPVVSLAEGLGLRAPQASVPARGKLPLVVAAAGGLQAAFVVDELLGERELMIKSLGPRLSQVPTLAGATLLADGQLALLLNAGGVIRATLKNRSRELLARFTQRATPSRKRLLVVEDTLTTRSLLRGLLESAGYEVLLAADGVDALQILHDQGADLVVSDLEMPRMDGFALTAAIRGSTRFANLPVVLVTGMEDEADKARGMQVGANAYIIKSTFEQRGLLEAVAQLL